MSLNRAIVVVALVVFLACVIASFVLSQYFLIFLLRTSRRQCKQYIWMAGCLSYGAMLLFCLVIFVFSYFFYPVFCLSSTWGGWRILKMTFVRVRKIYANFLFYFHFYSMNIIIYFKLFHFGVKSCVLRVSISSCSVWNDCGAWHGKKQDSSQL